LRLVEFEWLLNVPNAVWPFVFYPIPPNHGQNITRPGVNVKWVIGRTDE